VALEDISDGVENLLTDHHLQWAVVAGSLRALQNEASATSLVVAVLAITVEFRFQRQ
jgi:hypothetical protein